VSLLLRAVTDDQTGVTMLRSVDAPPNGVLAAIHLPDGDASWAIDSSYEPSQQMVAAAQAGRHHTVVVDTKETDTGLGPNSHPLSAEEVVSALEDQLAAHGLWQTTRQFMVAAAEYSAPTGKFEQVVLDAVLCMSTRDALAAAGYLTSPTGGVDDG
jgi:hypothetical protein